MLKVLIIDGEEENNLLIARKISELYSDVSIVNVTTVDDANEHLQNEKPDIVVINLVSHDTSGNDLLEKLRRWDFKIMVFHNNELYEIIGKSDQKQGFILKSK